MRKIAFIGATGMLGKPVVTALVDSGFQVSALVRKKETRFPEGVLPYLGDMRSREDLEGFLSGNDVIYLNLSVKPNEKPGDYHTETDGLINVIQAVKKTGVKRIAFVSSLAMNYQGMNGFSWWVFDLKKKAVEIIKASGIPYTIFYPSTFMENFGGNFRRGNRIFLAGKSEHKMWFISAADFGRQVSRALALPGNGNHEFVVQGPEGLTADEAAEIYVRHYPKGDLSISRAPMSVLRFLGRISRTIHYGAHIVEALNRYPEKFSAEQTWQLLGKPTTTLKEYAEKAAR